MPPRTTNAMQRLEGEGVRGVIARVVATAPLPRGDAMIERIGALIAAIGRERDVRRALGKSGKSSSRIGDVAAVAEVLDSSIEPRTDAGELAVRALLEVLLDATELTNLLPAFVARLSERWIFAQLGYAPPNHFASVAEHAQFRAEVAAVVREAARAIAANDYEGAVHELERALAGAAR